MKRIDFSKFKLYYDLGDDRLVRIVDWRKELGNYLLARLGGVDGVDLALRVYKSDGPVELSDDEYEGLKTILGRPIEQGGVVAAYYYSFLKNVEELSA